MSSPRLLRVTLWIACLANLGGAAVFAFPASPLGQLAGLPAAAPLLYRALTALFVLLFAGAYAWLAASAVIDRALVVFGAIGKSSAFLLVLVLWLCAEAATRSLVAISGDLLLAALMLRGLRRRP